MKTNEVLTKHNFITKIMLKDNDNELSKDLKVKIIKARIEYAKVRTQFDADTQEFIKNSATPEFRELQNKPEKTDEDRTKLQEMVNKINDEYFAYVNSRLNDDVNVNNVTFTEDELNEIINTNANNDVEINGTKLNSAEFIEALYSIFVNG